MRTPPAVTDNEFMTTDNDVTLPLGARLFPGVDLTLWVAIVVTALVIAAGITGIVVAAAR